MPNSTPAPRCLRTSLAKNVSRLRRVRGWTQAELAQASGLAQAAISYIERPDGKSPSLETIEALAAAFGVSVFVLLTDTHS